MWLGKDCHMACLIEATTEILVWFLPIFSKWCLCLIHCLSWLLKWSMIQPLWIPPMPQNVFLIGLNLSTLWWQWTFTACMISCNNSLKCVRICLMLLMPSRWSQRVGKKRVVILPSLTKEVLTLTLLGGKKVMRTRERILLFHPHPHPHLHHQYQNHHQQQRWQQHQQHQHHQHQHHQHQPYQHLCQLCQVLH